MLRYEEDGGYWIEEGWRYDGWGLTEHYDYVLGYDDEVIYDAYQDIYREPETPRPVVAEVRYEVYDGVPAEDLAWPVDYTYRFTFDCP